MHERVILALVETDLQLICNLRKYVEGSGGAKLVLARHSEEAILYLRGIGVYENRGIYPFPHLLVLDTWNPEADDLKLLDWLRGQARFKAVPVVLLASKHSGDSLFWALDDYCFIVDRDDPRQWIRILTNWPGLKSRPVNQMTWTSLDPPNREGLFG
jgi:CheY-like chemotaxis protein